MSLGDLAADVSGPETLQLAKSRSQRKEDWDSLASAVLDDRNDISKWDALLTDLERRWDTSSLELRTRLADVIARYYSALLERFPYLEEHWKRYSIFSYKSDGLDLSLAVLERATSAFPHSVSLWVDHLGALTAKHDKLPESSKAENLATLRGVFGSAAVLVGHHFNADPFWNKYIEFALQNLGKDDLLQIYLKIIRIPLYQYAHYHDQFAQIVVNYTASQILDEAEKGRLPTKLELMSNLEQKDAVDSFIQQIYENVQRRVTENWEFESQITQQAFSLNQNIPGQKEIWISYLDSCIANRTQEEVLIVFERALAARCYDVELWVKYAEYARAIPEKSRSIFERCIFNILPLSEASVRQNYLDFISSDFDDATQFLLKTLELYVGAKSGIYFKTPYIAQIRMLLRYWGEKIPADGLKAALESIVFGYFEHVDRYRKSSGDTKPKSKDISDFSRFLNDDSIGLVVVQYLKLLDDAKAVRIFYNKFHKEPALSRSVQFFKFCLELESEKRNLENVHSIMIYIKTESQLPKRAVDAFVDIHYEIVCNNLRQALSKNLADVLVTRHQDKSASLGDNAAARERIALNNFMLQDMHPRDRGAELMKMRSRHIAHPGIFTEPGPRILNPINDGEWFSLLDKNVKVTAPEFANLHNQGPIQYPDE